MAMPKPTKKKAPSLPRRKLVGVQAAPKDSFAKCKEYFHYDVDKKDISSVTKAYVKKTFSKTDAEKILANPEYQFYMYTHWAATIFWIEQGLPFDEKFQPYADKVKQHFEALIAPGEQILATKKQEVQKDATIIRLTPQQLMARKVSDTILEDLFELEESWINGGKETIDLYALFKKHDLKPFAVPIIRPRIEGWYNDYSDAYNKTCDQAVEGYRHIPKPELKRRMQACEAMLSDLDRIVSAGKAVRKPRVKKPRAADKQISQLKYLKEDTELKIVSINPVTIIGAVRLIVINTKYRTVTEYITSRKEGFEIKGTSLQGWDEAQSRTKTMRKPNEFIPICYKTVRQFGKAFDALTTKESKPTGRINTECVLLKVDK